MYDLPSLRSMSPLRCCWSWARGLGGGGLALVAVFLPSDLIDTPWFTRMSPPAWWGFVLAAMTVVLTALATGLSPRACGGGLSCRDTPTAGAAQSVPVRSGQAGPSAAGPVSAVGAVALAVGCPLCNKVVVMLLGVGGALDVWSPLQPVLGALAVLLLATLVLLRWQHVLAAAREPDI